MTVRCICYNITSDTLLASCYEARSIYAGQHLCNAVRQEDCLPRGSPSLAADRHQHRRQERAKEQGQISKREDIDATNFQAIIHFKEWRRFTSCVLLYSAAGRRGNPMPVNLTLVLG